MFLCSKIKGNKIDAQKSFWSIFNFFEHATLCYLLLITVICLRSPKCKEVYGIIVYVYFFEWMMRSKRKCVIVIGHYTASLKQVKLWILEQQENA